MFFRGFLLFLPRAHFADEVVHGASVAGGEPRLAVFAATERRVERAQQRGGVAPVTRPDNVLQQRGGVRVAAADVGVRGSDPARGLAQQAVIAHVIGDAFQEPPRRDVPGVGLHHVHELVHEHAGVVRRGAQIRRAERDAPSDGHPGRRGRVFREPEMNRLGGKLNAERLRDLRQIIFGEALQNRALADVDSGVENHGIGVRARRGRERERADHQRKQRGE